MQFKDFLKKFNKFKNIEDIKSGKITMDEFINQYSTREIKSELLDYAWETRDVLQDTLTTKNIYDDDRGSTYPNKYGAEDFKKMYNISFDKYKKISYEEQKKYILAYENKKFQKLNYVWTYAAIKYIDTYMQILNDLIIFGKQ